MFEKLFDFIVGVIDLLFFVRVVDEWEAGVVLRRGRYARSVGPGWHLLFPLGFERLVTVDTYPRPTSLPVQSLTTADGVAVVVSALVLHKVASPKRVLLGCGDHEEALLDALTGTLAQHVTGAAWSDLTTEEFWRTVTSAAKERARRWGIKVLDVQPRDVTRCRSLRLFGQAK